MNNMQFICIRLVGISFIPTMIRTLATAGFLATISQLEAAVRYTAPFGPGGTWNVYEYVDTATTFWLANQASTQAVHSGVSGHLVTIRSKEEDLAVGRMAGGDIWIGLTDQLQLGGTETGTNPQVDKWDGWRGDVAEIPLEVRELVQPNGWVWLSGEPYDYQAWDTGEPNNFGAGEGGVRRRGSGFFNDDGIGAFGQPASTAAYVIEYETHSPAPVPGVFQLSPIFPPTRLPGIEGGPGFAGIEVYRNGRPFDDVEPVIGSLAIGDLVNPLFGTAPTINFHDPQSGGGGLFPSGRLTFPGNTAADDNNFQVLIKGAIEVPAGQGGTWTFNIHADDGFAFRIDGVEFTSAHGNGYIDFADRGTLTYPEPTGDANTRGVINLLPGVYPFQFVMFELGGGAFCELSAAPGAHPIDASTSQWQLVNSALSPLKFVAAPLPPVITQYTPPPVVVNQGETATWSVEATGPGPLRYQWQKNTGINNWVNIPGATDSTYTIPSVQPGEHDGEYRVIVSNPAGSTATSLRTMAVAIQPPVNFAGYVVASPVSFITTTPPEQTINNHGIPFTAQQLESVRLADNTFLAQGTYHLFKIPNTGQMTIRWTGFGTGNHQIYFSYWNGSQFVIRDIRDAAENQSYEIAVNRPLAENFVYSLVNCTSGQINTDQLTVSGPSSETPILAAQPQSITASQGGTATFSVIATGSAPLYYQWRFNGGDISGATNSSYTITSVQPSQAGNYSVTVSNSAGSITSSNAILSVDSSSILAVSDPAFNNGDWDLVVFSSTPQSSATASQATDGNGNPDPYMTVTHTLGLPSTVRSIHVRKSAYNPATQGGIESITYSQDARVKSTEAGTIGGSTGPAILQGGKTFVIENGLTSPIRDSLNTALPSPYKRIQHQTLTAGNFVELVGANQFNFAQQPNFTVNGAPIQFGFFVANSHTVPVPTTRIIGADNFSITIKPAQSPPPIITAQPQNLTVPVGGNANFSVAATGTAPLTYQWQYNGADIPGATGFNYTIANVQTTNAGSYAVVVRNGGSSVTSQSAILTVNPPPAVSVIPTQLGKLLQMQITGTAGSLFVLETTADFRSWIPAAWATSIGLPTIFTIQVGANTNSFFRVRLFSLPEPEPGGCNPPYCPPIGTAEEGQAVTLNDGLSPAVYCKPCAVPLTTGEEIFDRTDLRIPGRGEIHFVMARSYRSQLDYNGPLGFGWNFTYNERLYIESNGDITRVNANSHIDRWVRQLDGSFTAPTGQFRTLRREANSLYVLREADGFQRFYRSDGRLLMHQDRFGNQMSFGYDERGHLRQVTDAYGRIVEFEFQTAPDGVERLARVRDFSGREIVYSYDGRGDLVAVRTPVVTATSTGNDFPNGRTEQYTYSSGFTQAELNHNLLSVTLPEEVAQGGPPAMVWVYGTNVNDAASLDRVVAETIGGTNASGIPAGGTSTIVYELLNQGVPPGNLDVARRRALMTLRNGNQIEFFANELGHHILERDLTRGLRTDEPTDYQTRSYFNPDGLLVRRVFPESNEVRYAYAPAAARPQQQNPIEIRRVAGPRGGGEDLVTTFSYEPLYNQIASVTDPRGNSSTYTPPIGARSAERYTTRFFYDYQESNIPVPQAQAMGIDLSGVARSLGDLNGDSQTDQLFGNLVRIQSPTIQLLPDSNEAQLSGSTDQQVITEIQWNDYGQRTSVIDPAGNVTAFEYYPDDDPDGDGLRPATLPALVTGAPAGYLRSLVTDSRLSARRTAQAPPEALETNYRYDPVGNTIAVRNPRGIVTEFEVNSLNETIKTTRGADVSVALQTGQLLENETPKRYVIQNVRDANGRVVRSETENRDSNTEGVGAFIEQTFTYDILNSLVRRTAELDASTTLTWHYRYDAEQLPTQTIKPEGNSDKIDYDERNRPFQVTRGFGSAEASTIQVDYDLNGNRKRVIDAEDTDGDGQRESATFAYDGFDRLIRATDALGNESLTDFDVADNAIRVQAWGHPPNTPGAPNVLLAHRAFLHDELGRVFQTDVPLFVSQGFTLARPPQLLDHDNNGFVTTRTEHDALSRSTFLVEDDLEVTRVIYDGVGRVIENIDQVGNRRRTAYDRNSNPVRSESVEVSPEGLVANEVFTTDYVYDQLDRLVRATDNAGHTTRFSYDSRNLLVHRSDPEGILTSDPLNLFPGQINGPGNTYSFSHDGLGRRIRQVSDLRIGGTGAGALDTSNPHNPDGQITLGYVFDGNSRAVGIVDDKGNRTSFGYDALDRKISHTFADGKSYAYTYDRDGNVRTITDPNGDVVTRVYDALNRLLDVTVQRGPGVLGTTRETYAYDGLSRLVRATDDNGNAAVSQHVVENVYDSLGRLLEERQDGKAISSRYTGDGKRTQITYPGGRVISRTFDAIDRIKQIQDGSTVLAATDWIGPGMRELRRLNGNGTQLTFLNDAGNLDAGYDSVQRLIQLRVLSAAGLPLVDREYAYNRASQRTAERRHDDFGLTDRYNYDSTYRVVDSFYDKDGLPGATPRDLSAIAYGYDGVGNRRNVTGHNAAGPFAENYTVNEVNEYTSVAGILQINDDSGNLTDDGTRLFAYDYRNRLVAVRNKATGNPIANYEYLPDGRRAKKTVYSPTVPGLIERMTRFFCDGAQEIEEQEGMSGATETTFVWSPVYIDELVQFQNSLGSFYTHQDARCSIVAVTDAAGAVVERIRYDDFGNTEIRGPLGQARSESAVGNEHHFQGRKLDRETGLLYFRARYFSPRTGRFLQRDPVWDAANVGAHYTFVACGPISRRDPFGHQGWGEVKPYPDEETWGQLFYRWYDTVARLPDRLSKQLEHAFEGAEANPKEAAAIVAEETIMTVLEEFPPADVAISAYNVGTSEQPMAAAAVEGAGLLPGGDLIKRFKRALNRLRELGARRFSRGVPQFSTITELGFPTPSGTGMCPKPGYSVDFEGGIYPHQGVTGVHTDVTGAKTAGGARSGLQTHAERQGLQRPPDGELHEVPSASGEPGSVVRVEALDQDVHRGEGRYTSMHVQNPETGRYEGASEQVARANRATGN